MVVAIIALFCSLAGGAVAARLITSKQVKDGSLQAKDFRKGLLGAVKTARGNRVIVRSGGATRVVELSLKAPAKGFVVLSYSAVLDAQTPATWMNVFLRDGGKQINGNEWWDAGDADGNFDLAQSNHLTLPVSKGRHTYSLSLEMSAGSAGVSDPRLTAQYVSQSL